MAHRNLAEFVAFLRKAEIVPRPKGEEWKAMIARIHVTGTIAEIDAETYEWFLECLPPKYQNGGLLRSPKARRRSKSSGPATASFSSVR